MSNLRDPKNSARPKGDRASQRPPAPRNSRASVRDRFQTIDWQSANETPPPTSRDRAGSETVRERFRVVAWRPSDAPHSISDEEANEIAQQVAQEKSVRNVFAKMK